MHEEDDESGLFFLTYQSTPHFPQSFVSVASSPLVFSFCFLLWARLARAARAHGSDVKNLELLTNQNNFLTLKVTLTGRNQPQVPVAKVRE